MIHSAQLPSYGETLNFKLLHLYEDCTQQKSQKNQIKKTYLEIALTDSSCYHQRLWDISLQQSPSAYMKTESKPSLKSYVRNFQNRGFAEFCHTTLLYMKAKH